MEGAGRDNIDLTPETEFWGHCLNMLGWAESNYNTCLLQKTIAFPLLKKLFELRDKKAEKYFKEEIATL